MTTKTFKVSNEGSMTIKLTNLETSQTLSIIVDSEGKDPIGTIMRESYFFKKAKSHDYADSILTVYYK